MVRRDPGVLSKLVSSVYVEMRDEKSKDPRVFDLGLRLRNKKRKLHVPHLVTYYEVEQKGYVDDLRRKPKEVWKFSDKVADIIRVYCD